MLPVSAPDPVPIRRRPLNPPPPRRRLRTYALDPSLGKRLDSVSVNETTLTVPWDDVLPWEKQDADEALKPGPVGEYLEVVDVDPGVEQDLRSGRPQQPRPPCAGRLAAFGRQSAIPSADGLRGRHDDDRAFRTRARPQGAFGRRDRSTATVRRRRTSSFNACASTRTPCATSNAYYSPDKKALLFGYFPAQFRATATRPLRVDGVLLPVAATSSRMR